MQRNNFQKQQTAVNSDLKLSPKKLGTCHRRSCKFKELQNTPSCTLSMNTITRRDIFNTKTVSKSKIQPVSTLKMELQRKNMSKEFITQ
jgi:hypothetical protein